MGLTWGQPFATIVLLIDDNECADSDFTDWVWRNLGLSGNDQNPSLPLGWRLEETCSYQPSLDFVINGMPKPEDQVKVEKVVNELVRQWKAGEAW